MWRRFGYAENADLGQHGGQTAASLLASNIIHQLGNGAVGRLHESTLDGEFS